MSRLDSFSYFPPAAALEPERGSGRKIGLSLSIPLSKPFALLRGPFFSLCRRPRPASIPLGSLVTWTAWDNQVQLSHVELDHVSYKTWVKENLRRPICAFDDDRLIRGDWKGLERYVRGAEMFLEGTVTIIRPPIADLIPLGNYDHESALDKQNRIRTRREAAE